MFSVPKFLKEKQVSRSFNVVQKGRHVLYPLPMQVPSIPREAKLPGRIRLLRGGCSPPNILSEAIMRQYRIPGNTQTGLHLSNVKKPARLRPSTVEEHERVLRSRSGVNVVKDLD